MFKKILLGLIICVMGIALAKTGDCFIVINEILADPASGIAGDANNDGTGSSSQDEFIELFNSSDESVNISGWQIADALRTRHVFEHNSFISPYSYFVVFGGGDPFLPDVNWQTASTGSLGLNNRGDTVSLFDIDSFLIDEVVYGRLGGEDQSLTRVNDEFVLHQEVDEINELLFSPGRSAIAQEIVEQTTPVEMDGVTQTSTVPEPLSLLTFGIGGIGFWMMRKICIV